MIRTNKTILLAIAMLLLMAIGCNTPKKMLCRTWDVVYMDFDAKQLSLAEGMKGQLVKQYQDSTFFTFEKNGKLYLQVPEARDTGTWALSRKADSLYANATNYTFTSKVLKLTADSLSLDSKTRDGINVKFVCTPLPIAGTK